MTLQQLCEQHYIDVRRFLCRLTSDFDQAEDLTQVTFLKACAAWTPAQEERPPLQLLAWLYQIARRSCYDATVHNQTRKRYFADIALDNVLLFASDVAIDIEQRLTIRDAMQQLNPTQKQALAVVASGGNAPVLARQAQIANSSASMRIHRAREAFRLQYEEA